MNTYTPPSLAAIAAIAERRHGSRQVVSNTDRLATHYRERDFGIGYGRSSGYVRVRSYTADNQRPLFRVG
ncbi:MAG: hypothetical protein COW59_12505 [Lysobacterales bacterium CG17_big_fil_post_rev_8_21_14_2_50_64_11]|nr:MAG: hypothetical protein COW59_12505 [Xanthomonadales bacterium CG17_big_fil_post_rev_8_21_14_2_50_64_11]